MLCLLGMLEIWKAIYLQVYRTQTTSEELRQHYVIFHTTSTDYLHK